MGRPSLVELASGALLCVCVSLYLFVSLASLLFVPLFSLFFSLLLCVYVSLPRWNCEGLCEERV